ncbi:MAG: nuclear transport factor 2 family protein, partial [Acidimicrobiales bacterium]
MSDNREHERPFDRAEVENAFGAYLRLGVQSMDWDAWTDLFTEDAIYVDQHLGASHGRTEIKSFVVNTMGEFPALTAWIEWAMIDGNYIAIYAWNNLPDPRGEDARYGFPNTTFLEYAGSGMFKWEADYYNVYDSGRVIGSWVKAGGSRTTEQDRLLKGIEGWSRALPTTECSRHELLREFTEHCRCAALGMTTGHWARWIDQFTVD